VLFLFGIALDAFNDMIEEQKEALKSVLDEEVISADEIPEICVTLIQSLISESSLGGTSHALCGLLC
jgi:hypothetical protein